MASSTVLLTTSSPLNEYVHNHKMTAPQLALTKGDKS